MQLTKERVFLLRQAIVKIAQILTGSGIEVTQRGVSAYVRSDTKTGKPVQVNLPFLADDAPDELVNAIQGFLDHEVAHVLFTDFTALKKLSSRTEHSFANCLEDARIEQKMAEQYQGSAINLARTGEFFLNSIIKPQLERLKSEGAGEAEYTQALLAPALRAAVGQFSFVEFMDEDDKWTMVPQLKKAVDELSSQIAKVSTTAGTVSLAKKLIASMSEEKAPPAPPPPAPAPSEEEDEDEEEAPPIPASADEEEEEPAPAPADEEEEEEPAPTPADEEEEEEPKPTPGGEEGEGEDVASESPENDEDDSTGEVERDGSVVDPSGAESEPTSEPKDSATSTDALSEIDREGANDYDDSVSSALSRTVAESSVNAPYLVFTTEHDVVEPLKLGSGFNAAMLTSLEKKVDGMAGPMQKDLERAIVARSRATWEGGLRKGRINAANLSRIATGDDRVFRRRQEATTRDVAVELVIDCSGSMSGSKIHTAAAAAFALSQVLDRLKISNEVIGFTTGAMTRETSEQITKEEKAHKISYSRKEPLYMPIIKSFSERMSTDVKSRFAWLPNGRFFANNVDGESVMLAARRLASRKEAGKCLIVLSDGAPACYGDMRAASKHLRTTVETIEAAGIKVIGIGVESTDVTRYYPKNIVINRVDELPTRVIGELRKLLLQ